MLVFILWEIVNPHSNYSNPHTNPVLWGHCESRQCLSCCSARRAVLPHADLNPGVFHPIFSPCTAEEGQGESEGVWWWSGVVGTWQLLTTWSHSEIGGFLIIFSDHSVNIQRLGCGKPLKLVTTCMKPPQHDPSLLCAPADCAINTYRQVSLWIYRWQKQEASREAEPLPSCCPSTTYSTKGCCSKRTLWRQRGLNC